MPIRVPNNIPALETLRNERIPVITEKRANRQDIRPLQVLILNLMPDKIRTETQLLRLLGATPLQVEVTLIHPATHQSKNTPKEHLSQFYKTHNEIKEQCFDALIVTGAPIEHLPFEEVTYWEELSTILNWANTHVYSSLFLCWGAQAGLYHYHNIPKHDLPEKKFGVYRHQTITPYTLLTNGFDDEFGVPVSRNTEIHASDLNHHDTLEILVESKDSGLCLVYEEAKHRVYMFNHLEYDAETLKREYERDAAKDPATNVPANYYPDDNPKNTPHITWRAHRNLLFSNWLNMVYQGTPYDLHDLLKEE